MLQVLLLSCLISLCFSECPTNYITWMSRCYYFDSNETPFVTAEESCIQFGGHLASVHEGFTNAFLAQQSTINFTSSTFNDAWIGATTLIKPGNFSWTDDSKYDFTNWGKMNNVSGQDCAGLNGLNGLWQPEDCFKPKPYICEIPQKAVATTTTTTTKATTTKKPTQCPAGWVFLYVSRSCYGNLGINTWNEAERICNSVGANLISIHSIEENNFVQTLENRAGHWLWIGGNVTYRNGNVDVKWTDGSPYDFSWFKNTHTGNSQCLNFGDHKFSERWYTDTACNTNVPYYCKKAAAF